MKKVDVDSKQNLNPETNIMFIYGTPNDFLSDHNGIGEMDPQEVGSQANMF
jgi:hypothetical protein